VCKSEEETQLQSKGVLVKGFGYLLEDYLGLVVRYPILVRVSGLSSDYLLFGEISLERDIVLVDESILKKLCWVFSPKRVSQDKSCVYCGCLSFSDPYACNYCFNSLKLKNIEYT
jgi:hypothetical protein